MMEYQRCTRRCHGDGLAVPTGVTLLELLVTFSFIAILIGLLLVAVQGARETARRQQCQSHLRQIGVAVAQYEGTFTVYPPGASRVGNYLLSILPFVEQQAVYDTVMRARQRGLASDRIDAPAIALYLCPSDPAPPVPNEQLPGANYAGCSGTWLESDGWNGIFGYWVPVSRDPVGPISAGDVLDGLSHTIAVSEIARADNTYDRLRVNWVTPRLYFDIDVFATACGSIPPKPNQYGWRGDPWSRGTPWFQGGMETTLYNHVLTPNGPSCHNGGGVPEGASTAASFHGGGVNVVFADGHTVFMAESTDRSTWRDYASRNGSP